MLIMMVLWVDFAFDFRGIAEALQMELKPDGHLVSVVYPPDTGLTHLIFHVHVIIVSYHIS